MANKRMLSMQICDSDAFLEMSTSAQNLYFHLCLRADDDGFIGNPRKIMKFVSCSDDDLKLLIAKKFVLAFGNGVIVIKHWRIHNCLSSGRYKETAYLDEKRLLLLKDDKSYSFTEGSPIDDSKVKALFSAKKPIEIEAKTSGEHVENKRSDNGEKTENPDIDLDRDLDLDITTDKEILNKFNILCACARETTIKEAVSEFLKKNCAVDFYREQIKALNDEERQDNFEAVIEALLNGAHNGKDLWAISNLDDTVFAKIIGGYSVGMVTDKINDGAKYVWKAVYNNAKEKEKNKKEFM